MTDLFEIDFSERSAQGELIWYEQEDDMDEYNEQESDEVAAEAEQAEYHRRERMFRCDLCDETTYSTEKEAKDYGWLLTPNEAICPENHD